MRFIEIEKIITGLLQVSPSDLGKAFTS